VFEVGKRTQPLCDIMEEGEVCWTEIYLSTPGLECYLINHDFAVMHHGNFTSDRAKIDGSRRLTAHTHTHTMHMERQADMSSA